MKSLEQYKNLLNGKMLRRVLISLILVITFSCKKERTITVDVDCTYNLGYDILRIVEKPIWLPDSIKVDFMGRNGYLIIKDCKGNADLILYDDEKNIILKGSFKESNIFKKRLIYGSKKDSTLINIPVIDGDWKFNNFTAKKPFPLILN